MNSYTDQEYLEGIKKEDNIILSSFYKKFYPMIRAYINKNNGTEADAKDLFQDCSIVLFRKMKEGDFKLTAKLSTYINSVCRRMWWNRLKKNKRENSEIPTDDLLQVDDTEVIEKTERYSLYREKFQKLGEDCKKLLMLYFEKNKGKEIAEQLGMTLPYTKKKIHVCKKKLTSLIKSDPVYSELANF